jgi:hypothetical protein
MAGMLVAGVALVTSDFDSAWKNRPKTSVIVFRTTNDGGGFTAWAKYQDKDGQHYADVDAPISVVGLTAATLMVQGGSCSIEVDGVWSEPIEADPIALCLWTRS